MGAKGILRSTILKAAAFAAAVGCFAGTLYIGETAVTETVKEARNSDYGFYNFEGSFQESVMLGDVMDDLALCLESGLTEGFTQKEFEEGFSVPTSLDYYARMGDTVLKNTDLTVETAAQYPAYLLYSQDTMDANYTVGRFNMSLENFKGEAEILIGMGEEQYAEMKALWTTERDALLKVRNTVLVLIAAALVLYVYLLCVTGKSGEDGAVHMLTIDRAFVEVSVLAGALPLFGTCVLNAMLTVELLDGVYQWQYFLPASILAAAAAFALAMEISLSLVRNLKNRTFLQRSLIFRLLRLCVKAVGRLWKVLRGLAGLALRGSLERKAVILFGVYAFVQFFFTVYIIKIGLWSVLILILWFLAAAHYILTRVSGFARIAQALHGMREGETAPDLSDLPEGVFADAAEDIDCLGEGMQTALDKAVRAERLKSELITNVSHDLKTPLTSIISYSELLCKEELQPEEANDYAKIIYHKSLRLKNLTSDLFDISKVQSGAEEIVWEQLDVCTLVRQALAEQEAVIAESGLFVKARIPENPLHIRADGRKMSRVLENLLINCAKYALAGTRVFVTVTGNENTAQVEIKNTSNYELDFDAEEITERFVRGDTARTTEGSGLGLAIAKSYTEACGGTFRVEIDGDQFKVRICFEKA